MNESSYLQAVQRACQDYAKQIRALAEDETAQGEVLAILEKAIAFEKQCREKHTVGARFSVIPNQLKVLLDKCKHEIDLHKDRAADGLEKTQWAVEDDELTIYVYLFNARGGSLRSWTSLLTPLSVKNYSVNRPLYANQHHVNELIRNKPVTSMHAYLEVVIKKADIISLKDNHPHDALGHPLLRVKEKTISLPRIRYFHYLGKKYKLLGDVDVRLIEET